MIYTKKNKIKKSGALCQMSNDMCCMSPVTCHMALTPIFTGKEPPCAKSHSMQSRMLLLVLTYQLTMICKDQQLFFLLLCAAFLLPFLAKVSNIASWDRVGIKLSGFNFNPNFLPSRAPNNHP